MDGVAGQEGWRWIFSELHLDATFWRGFLTVLGLKTVLEGLGTVALAFIAPWLIHDSIESSKWLDEDEKRFLRVRLSMDRQGRSKGPFKSLYVRQAFKEYKIWMCAFIYASDAVATYGLSFSLPTIIRQLGYTSASAQLLTIPVYVFAAICTVLCAWFADKSGKRMKFVIIPYSVANAGFIVCLATPQPRLPGLILFAVYLIAAGVYAVVPAIIAWNSNNTSGQCCHFARIYCS